MIVPERGRTRYRLEVYETQPIEIRAGDRIRWTRNDKKPVTSSNGEQAEGNGDNRKTRVRFLLADGRKLSLRHDDPQLRHLDHAWSSTVHGAQGSTADGVIAVLDSGHGALTDQSTFYVEISRARDSAVVLTDNCEQLVEVLEAHTGERATALEAVGEEIGPDAEIVSIPDQAPNLVAARGVDGSGGEGAERWHGPVPVGRLRGVDRAHAGAGCRVSGPSRSHPGGGGRAACL